MNPTGPELVSQLKNEDVPKTEPALVIGTAATGTVAAAVLIFKYVFPNVPDDILNSAITIVAVLLPAVVSWLIRSKVWSPKSVQKVVDQSVTNAIRESNLKVLPKRSPDLPKRDVPKNDPRQDWMDT